MIDFMEFYKNFILFTDRVIPTLKPIEQPILLQIFSRTVGMGRSTCQLSYDDFHNLTGQSLPTIKKALRNLIENNNIKLVNVSRSRMAKTYEFVWTENIPDMRKLSRDPEAVVRTLALGGEYTNLIDKLTAQDRDMLDMILSNLPSDEESHYRRMADNIKTPGADPEKVFKEIVAREKFGKLRLIQYEQKANAIQVVDESGK